MLGLNVFRLVPFTLPDRPHDPLDALPKRASISLRDHPVCTPSIRIHLVSTRENRPIARPVARFNPIPGGASGEFRVPVDSCHGPR